MRAWVDSSFTSKAVRGLKGTLQVPPDRSFGAPDVGEAGSADEQWEFEAGQLHPVASSCWVHVDQLGSNRANRKGQPARALTTEQSQLGWLRLNIFAPQFGQTHGDSMTARLSRDPFV